MSLKIKFRGLMDSGYLKQMKAEKLPCQVNFDKYLVTSSMADCESGINVVLFLASAWDCRLHKAKIRMQFDALRK